MKEVLRQIPAGVILPDITFFEPRRRFVDWAATRWAGRLVYDVGAGRGHVAKALADAGLLLDAFDVSRRPTLDFPVRLENAANVVYEPESVVMLCRPCHGTFPETVVEMALERGVNEIAYIGFEDRLVGDLGDLAASFQCALEDAGHDREAVWTCQPEGG